MGIFGKKDLRMRFVKLTQEQQEQVEKLYRESDNHRERQRLGLAQAVDRDTWSEGSSRRVTGAIEWEQLAIVFRRQGHMERRFQ